MPGVDPRIGLFRPSWMRCALRPQPPPLFRSCKTTVLCCGLAPGQMAPGFRVTMAPSFVTVRLFKEEQTL